MKALRKLKSGSGLSLEEVPIPTVSDNDVLIKIKTTGICGTDLHIYSWDAWAKKTIPIPITIGHEFVGEIVQIAKDVSHLQIGDRVSGEGHLTCGICHLCHSSKRHLCPNAKSIGIQRDGAFAEFLKFPAQNVVKIPEDISDDIAAILDPLGNAVHTLQGVDLAGEDILVTGAGPIGLMAIALLKHLGAHTIVVTDVNPYRLNLAKKMGATHVVNIKETTIDALLPLLNLENGFTVGLEMSGNEEAIHTQLHYLAPGSLLAALGLATKNVNIDWTEIIFKGLKIQGIYGRKMFETWTKMITLLQSGLDLSPLITHHYDFRDYQAAFEKAQSGAAGKILLHWSG